MFEILVILLYFGIIGATIYSTLKIMDQKFADSDSDSESESESEDSGPRLFSLARNKWYDTGVALNRPLETVFLEDKVKTELTNAFEDFQNNEQWYRDKFIPYKMGILIHGGLGEGKTSLISGLSTKYDLDVYYISISAGDVLMQIEKIPQDRNNIIVIENLDLELSQLGDRYSYVYPRLLNVMDGLLSPSGSIFIVTTSSLEGIPEEFKRPGRFTHKIEILPPSKDVIANYFQWFYSDVDSRLGTKFAESITSKVSMCVIQNHLLRNRTDPENAINTARAIGM
jgi:chaperone BCS1